MLVAVWSPAVCRSALPRRPLGPPQLSQRRPDARRKPIRWHGTVTCRATSDSPKVESDPAVSRRQQQQQQQQQERGEKPAAAGPRQSSEQTHPVRLGLTNQPEQTPDVGASSSSSSLSGGGGGGGGKLDAAINAIILLGAGSVAVAALLSVYSPDYWDAPGLAGLQSAAARVLQEDWSLYLAAVDSHPIRSKAAISGTVYAVGDLVAQVFEGRGLGGLDRGRVLRSALCGFCAHGPLSHLYYERLESTFSWLAPDLAPSSPLAVGMKVLVDQTAWSVFWNATYYALLGALKLDSPAVIASTIASTWWPLLQAGWRMWPLAHLLTYGVIPTQHRLLWVDCVEIVWVTVLSLVNQQQRQQQQLLAAEAAAAAAATSAAGGSRGAVPPPSAAGQRQGS